MSDLIRDLNISKKSSENKVLNPGMKVTFFRRGEKTTQYSAMTTETF
jgi:hypothetical protein